MIKMASWTALVLSLLAANFAMASEQKCEAFAEEKQAFCTGITNGNEAFVRKWAESNKTCLREEICLKFQSVDGSAYEKPHELAVRLNRQNLLPAFIHAGLTWQDIFFSAVQENQIDILELSLAAKSNPASANSIMPGYEKSKTTPLMYATLKSLDQVMRVLLKNNARPEDINSEGYSALAILVSGHFLKGGYRRQQVELDYDTLVELVRGGAAVNQIINGKPILSYLAKFESNYVHSGIQEALQFLLNNQLTRQSINVDQTDSRGYSPTMEAMASNECGEIEPTVKKLVMAGANVNLTNAEGESALLLLAKKDFTKCLRGEYKGYLDFASLFEYLGETMKDRDTAAADLTLTDKEGNSIYYYVESNTSINKEQKDKVVDFLRKHGADNY